MREKLSTLSVLAFLTVSEPLQALAQSTPSSPSEPRYYWPGPWHM